MNWYYIPLIIVAGLLLLSYSPMAIPPFSSTLSDINGSFLDLNDTPKSYSGQANNFVQVNAGETQLIFTASTPGGGTPDSNKVKVSENDTNAEYLFTKLQAGSNITITKQNAGGDENILISSTGGGAADTNCSLNADCIFTGRINAPTQDMNINDANVTGSLRVSGQSTFINQMDVGNILPRTNNTMGLGVNALRFASLFVRDINSFGVAGFQRGTFADLNSTIFQSKDGNILNDLNIIRNVYVGNILYTPQLCLNGDCQTSWPAGGSGVNWTQINAVVPWQDVNVADNITATSYLRNDYLGNLFPVADANISSDARYRQDSNCDNNSLCRLLSSTFVWDTNAVLDGRYALSGSTGLSWSQINAVVPWQDVNVADNITATSYLRNDFLGNLFPVPDANVADNITLTNITQITNRSYTDLQNKPYIPTELDIDGNFYTQYVTPYDSNFWSRFRPANDGNYFTRFSINFDGNFYSKNAGDMNWITFNSYVNPAGGIVDANIANDLTIASTKNASFTLDLNVGKKANIYDLNIGRDVNVAQNLKVDNNVLVSKDLNVSRYAGFDSNVTLNPVGIAIRFKDFTGKYMCLGGNNVDVNGGIWIYAC